jgi:D-beta-D-heptose 7-phosphate kinase/D-beta-D-heptose 1-phosphate adenosyltransferase
MRVTVVGDTLLDVDVHGTAERLTPDGPAPVVDVHTTTQRAGGAGLVASMLMGDGHEVELVTALADDDAGGRLRACLAGVRLVGAPSGAATPVKTRIKVGDHAVARVDEGCADPGIPHIDDAALDAVRRAEVLVVADYGRGLLSDERLRRALEERGHRVPLVWDPHPRGSAPVASTTVATPNLAEATAAAGVPGSDVPSAARSAVILRERWGCPVAVTLGERGALLLDDAGLPVVLPARPMTAADPCGAGDRLSAAVATSLAAGATLESAVRAGVEEAALYLAAGGVASIGSTPTPRMLTTRPDAEQVIADVRRRHGTVVATGGCFDLLHAGHARVLASARALGDCLVVCVNTDSSIARLKGPQRPIMGEKDRVELLLALECVDAVAVFDEETPEALLNRLRPDVWVKGGDYTAADLPEARLIETWGGQTVTVPLYPAHSTTALAAALGRVG